MQAFNPRKIRVGISTRHGMADEMSLNPPDGIEYCFPEPTQRQPRWIRSPLKSYLMSFEKPGDFDVLEGVLSPVLTPFPWVCSLDCFQAAVAFSLGRVPIPKWCRIKYVESLFRQDHFHRLIFWSEAARKSMEHYGGVKDEWLLRKSEVVYPAIKEVTAPARRTGDTINLMFSGAFFRKGGASVVDAFNVLCKKIPELRLRLCCDEKYDFSTPNTALKNKYLSKIHENHAIQIGRVSRQQMLDEILPNTDIYLLPTYNEAFGFAILEAMAHGIPVVSTQIFAIPEIIQHGSSGFLIDLGRFDPESMFRGYVVNNIPDDFHHWITSQLIEHTETLILSPTLRTQFGDEGKKIARSRFSFEHRNQRMASIYRGAVS